MHRVQSLLVTTKVLVALCGAYHLSFSFLSLYKVLVALCSAYSGLAHVLLVTAKVLVALCCATRVFEST